MEAPCHLLPNVWNTQVLQCILLGTSKSSIVVPNGPKKTSKTTVACCVHDDSAIFLTFFLGITMPGP